MEEIACLIHFLILQMRKLMLWKAIQFVQSYLMAELEPMVSIWVHFPPQISLGIIRVP